MHRDVLIDLIRYAVMAPSSHNTQPWLFTVGDNEILVHPDLKRRLPVVDPDDHALFISLGCALENLAIATEHANAHATLEYFPDDTEAAAIRVRLCDSEPERAENRDCATSRLFAAIPARQSTRRAYDGRPLPQAAYEALQAVAAEPLVRTQVITEPLETETAIRHVEAACRAQFEDPAFVAELRNVVEGNRRVSGTHS